MVGDMIVATVPDKSAAMRLKVVELESVILNSPEHIRPVDVADLPVTHHFSKGVYARELFIPKGHFLSGKIHKYTNLNIMSKGDMSVLTEDGVKRVQAPFTVVSPPGTKRIAYAHEDTIWTTIHGTDETDVDKIEQEFIAQSEQEFIEFCEKEIGMTKQIEAA